MAENTDYVSTASIRTAFSKLAQTNYATPRAAAAAYRRLGETNKPLFDVKPNFVADTENNGSDEATDNFIVTNTFSEAALPTYFSFQDLPYWLQMIMGVIQSSGSEVPYEHVITALDKAVSRSHPVRTFLQEKGGDLIMYASVGLREVRIAKEGTGKLTVTLTPHGQGKESVNPASYTFPAVVNDRVYAFNNEATHNVNDIADAVSTDYRCSIETWEWVFTNNQYGDGYTDCSEFYEAGNNKSGQVKAEHLTGAYDWKFNFTVRLAASDPLKTSMRQGNRLTVTTTITSNEVMEDEDDTPYSAVITDPNAKIMDITDSAPDQGFIMRAISCQIMPSRDTGAYETEATVVNDVASYTT